MKTTKAFFGALGVLAIIAVPITEAAAQKLTPGRGVSDGIRGGGGGYRGGGGWGGLATGLAIGTVTGIILSQPPAGAVESTASTTSATSQPAAAQRAQPAARRPPARPAWCRTRW